MDYQYFKTAIADTDTKIAEIKADFAKKIQNPIDSLRSVTYANASQALNKAQIEELFTKHQGDAATLLKEAEWRLNKADGEVLYGDGIFENIKETANDWIEALEALKKKLSNYEAFKKTQLKALYAQKAQLISATTSFLHSELRVSKEKYDALQKQRADFIQQLENIDFENFAITDKVAKNVKKHELYTTLKDIADKGSTDSGVTDMKEIKDIRSKYTSFSKDFIQKLLTQAVTFIQESNALEALLKAARTKIDNCLDDEFGHNRYKRLVINDIPERITSIRTLRENLVRKLKEVDEEGTKALLGRNLLGLVKELPIAKIEAIGKTHKVTILQKISAKLKEAAEKAKEKGKEMAIEQAIEEAKKLLGQEPEEKSEPKGLEYKSSVSLDIPIVDFGFLDMGLHFSADFEAKASFEGGLQMHNFLKADESKYISYNFETEAGLTATAGAGVYVTLIKLIKGTGSIKLKAEAKVEAKGTASFGKNNKNQNHFKLESNGGVSMGLVGYLELKIAPSDLVKKVIEEFIEGEFAYTIKTDDYELFLIKRTGSVNFEYPFSKAPDAIKSLDIKTGEWSVEFVGKDKLMKIWNDKFGSQAKWDKVMKEQKLTEADKNALYAKYNIQRGKTA